MLPNFLTGHLVQIQTCQMDLVIKINFVGICSPLHLYLLIIQLHKIRCLARSMYKCTYHIILNIKNCYFYSMFTQPRSYLSVTGDPSGLREMTNLQARPASFTIWSPRNWNTGKHTNSTCSWLQWLY